MIICNTIKLFRDTTGLMSKEELKEVKLYPKFRDGGFSLRQLNKIKLFCKTNEDYHIISVIKSGNLLKFINKLIENKEHLIRYYVGSRMKSDAVLKIGIMREDNEKSIPV